MKDFYPKLVLFAIILILSLSILGCDTKNNQDQSSKVINKALNTFLDTGDIEKAQQVLRELPRDSSGQAAQIAQGTLQIAKASQFSQAQIEIKKNILQTVSEIKDSAFKINELVSNKENLSAVVEQRQKKLSILQQGNENVTGLAGLKEKLQQKKDDIQSINNQISQLETQAAQAKTKADNLQSAANKLMDQARTTNDTMKKAELQTQAYDIIAGKEDGNSKAEYMSQNQHYLDQIGMLESKSDIVEKELLNYQQEIDKLENQIEEIKQVNKNLNLQQNISTIETQINQVQQALSAKLTGLDDIVSEYDSLMGQALEQLDNAQGNFKRAGKNRDISQISKLFLADIQAEKARLYAKAANLKLALSKNLSNLAKIVNPAIASSLNAAEKRYSNGAQDHYSKSLESFEEAENTYQQSNFRPECPVLKQRIVVSLQKANLASTFGQNDLYNSTVETIKTIAEKAIECDENFAQSSLGNKINQLQQ